MLLFCGGGGRAWWCRGVLRIDVSLQWCFHTRARQRQDDKTNVEPVHSYDAFHTNDGVKGIIGMHRFNICLVVVLSLSCRCLALV